MTNFFKTEKYATADWYKRTKVASDIINNNKNFKYIYEFGCGDGALRFLIPSDKKYFGYDLNRRFENINVIDFNVNFPKITLGDIKERLCVCLGFFEYIIDMPSMITKIVTKFDNLIFSYIHNNIVIPKINNKIYFTSIDIENIVSNKFKYLQKITNVLDGNVTTVYFASNNNFEIKSKLQGIFTIKELENV